MLVSSGCCFANSLDLKIYELISVMVGQVDTKISALLIKLNQAYYFSSLHNTMVNQMIQ